MGCYRKMYDLQIKTDRLRKWTKGIYCSRAKNTYLHRIGLLFDFNVVRA